MGAGIAEKYSSGSMPADLPSAYLGYPFWRKTFTLPGGIRLMNEPNPFQQFTEIGKAAATRTPPRKRTGTQILLTILALILMPLGGIVVVCGVILWEGGRGTSP